MTIADRRRAGFFLQGSETLSALVDIAELCTDESPPICSSLSYPRVKRRRVESETKQIHALATVQHKSLQLQYRYFSLSVRSDLISWILQHLYHPI